jgi:hypothetical protein
MSAEKVPILSGAMPAFEMFMTAWEQLSTKCTRLSKWTSVGLEWAVKYYKRMDGTNAYIIAMCGFEQCFPFLHVFTDCCQSLTHSYGWGGSERTGGTNTWKRLRVSSRILYVSEIAQVHVY